MGVGGIGGVGLGLELPGESEEVTKELKEEVDMGLIRRSLVFIGENNMRTPLDGPSPYMPFLSK